MSARRASARGASRHGHLRLWAGLLALGASIIGTALPAAAAEWTLSAGGSINGGLNRGDWTPVGYLDVAGERRPFKAITWQPVGSLGWIGARDDTGDPAYDRNVWVAALGVRGNIQHGLFGSFQVGYASDTTPALSSHPQFITTLGWEYRSLQLAVRHISNGKLFDGPNRGETMVLAGWRFP